jgi:hypothetical protein
MAIATIPVDLRNPGQVFACLGLMEAAEILCGPAEGGFGYREAEANTTFSLTVVGDEDPVERVLLFLARARIKAEAPMGSNLSLAKWKLPTHTREDPIFPGRLPDSPATLPDVDLRDQFGHRIFKLPWLCALEDMAARSPGHTKRPPVTVSSRAQRRARWPVCRRATWLYGIALPLRARANPSSRCSGSRPSLCSAASHMTGLHRAFCSICGPPKARRHSSRSLRSDLCRWRRQYVIAPRSG